MIELKNIYDLKGIVSSNEEKLIDEFFQNILVTEHFRVERIISECHSSPEGFWYDQDKNEFVLLLKGSAEILFEDNNLIKMKEGDYIIIPAHVKHRVEKTDSFQKTFWLTIFY
ncbi:cupin domain-containing protein [Rosettibacter firmus]|uniref:cupin domain-containing protein n=1 Tax=Rosettibacter firmus TaxID=3111522 RepID=UPI00336BE32C